MRETLIFIPGFASNATAWSYQAKQLGENFDVSTLVMDRFSTRQEMVEHLLSSAPNRFILAGHSMGGWVAQAAAAQAGKRITKLLLFNTWADLEPQMLAMQMQVLEALKQGKIKEAMKLHLPLLVHPSRLQDPKLISTLQSMLASFSIETLVRQMEAMLRNPSAMNDHPLIQTPTLIVHSQQDALFPKEHEILASRIKGSKLKEIPHCGHSCILEKPEETTSIIRSFIEKNH